VTYINSEVLPELNGASRLGASCLPSASFPGMSLPAARPSAALLPIPGAHAVRRVRGRVAVLVPQVQQDGVKAPLGQINVHNYMTSVSATGEGAAGPPREREPV
jgi:hypothetical protein